MASEQRLVPIAVLSQLLDTARGENLLNLNDEDINLVVISAGKSKIALVVDYVLDIEDTVIKTLQGPTKKNGLYQGAAFMGDGTVGLILSAEGLMVRAGTNLATTRCATGLFSATKRYGCSASTMRGSCAARRDRSAGRSGTSV
jgi:chemotaxis protein histidine kinase CheA